jgi:hypothetical protein
MHFLPYLDTGPAAPRYDQRTSGKFEVHLLCHGPCSTFVGSNGSQRPERGRPQL